MGMRTLLLGLAVVFADSAFAEQFSHMPVDEVDITSDYGLRSDPFLGNLASHTGLDFRADTGTSVKAVADGKVIFAGWYKDKYKSALGRVVEIDHGNGLVTKYGHNSELKVKAGEKIKAGQEIALSGNTGRSSGPHVHFEVAKDGAHTDPADYLPNMTLKLGDLERLAEKNRQSILGAGDCIKKRKDPEINYVKARFRDGYHLSFAPVKIEKIDGELVIEFFEHPNFYTRQRMKIKTPDNSDPILNHRKIDHAINPKLTHVSSSEANIDRCQLALHNLETLGQPIESPIEASSPAVPPQAKEPTIFDEPTAIFTRR